MDTFTETIKTLLVFILIVYSIVISMLYWHQYTNMQSYQKEKEDILISKEKELINRESIVVDKEICFRELTKLKTIQSTALDVLKSYAIGVDSHMDNNTKLTVEHMHNEHILSEEDVKTTH